MIVNNNIQSVATLYGAAQPSASVRGKAAGRQTQQDDEVVISAAGQSFSNLLQKLRSGDEVREDKVDYYTRAIEDGSYHVDAGDIAARMLDQRF